MEIVSGITMMRSKAPSPSVKILFLAPRSPMLWEIRSIWDTSNTLRYWNLTRKLARTNGQNYTYVYPAFSRFLSEVDTTVRIDKTLGKKKLSPHTMTTIVLGTRMASCHYISRYLLYPVLEPMVKLPFSACAREGFCTFDFLVDTDWTLDAKTFTASMICTGASVEELRVNASE